jgi:hypothetical protein
LNTGLSMAQDRAQPRDTTSLALRVRLGVMPKVSCTSLYTAGTRVLAPTTSTVLMSLACRPVGRGGWKGAVRWCAGWGEGDGREGSREGVQAKAGETQGQRKVDSRASPVCASAFHR